ncbi:MAG TPA: diaminopimelate epimerase [Firmicutes bacterium]|jgi:diaminopimelate epimerase|nr:diaminopimelate epimerase [Bacillota bacterium]
MKFTKMQGIGNDYIYIDAFHETVPNPTELAVKVSDRHFGIGGDGLVLILPSENADAKMRMFNADGSEAEMCGNAIRCVGKYLYEHQLIPKKALAIETLSGMKHLRLLIHNDKVEFVEVDMGIPELNPALIPVSLVKERIIAEAIEVNQHYYHFTGVSMGNPHCVIFVPELTDPMILSDGPALEIHPFFPRKTNVEFVSVTERDQIVMRVWERGSGETLACGTGACAAVVAAILNQRTDNQVHVNLRGGVLTIEWNPNNHHVYMTGPAVEVFQGVWPD